MNHNDEQWMQQALTLAHKAEENGEVPVGALLVKDDEIISEGWNQLITKNDPTAHAEILALRSAANQINNYRLVDTTLYVTLEPCAMCATALIHARVKRVVFGAYDPKAGAAGSLFDILGTDKLNHKIDVTGGVLEDQCSELLQQFFRVRRS